MKVLMMVYNDENVATGDYKNEMIVTNTVMAMAT